MPFGDGELEQNCLTIFIECACPEKKQMVEQTSLSRLAVSRRTNDLSDKVKETFRERLKCCAAFSVALDDSTDVSDTALLVVFIKVVTVGFDAAEELLDMPAFSP